MSAWGEMYRLVIRGARKAVSHDENVGPRECVRASAALERWPISARLREDLDTGRDAQNRVFAFHAGERRVPSESLIRAHGDAAVSCSDDFAAGVAGGAALMVVLPLVGEAVVGVGPLEV